MRTPVWYVTRVNASVGTYFLHPSIEPYLLHPSIEPYLLHPSIEPYFLHPSIEPYFLHPSIEPYVLHQHERQALQLLSTLFPNTGKSKLESPRPKPKTLKSLKPRT